MGYLATESCRGTFRLLSARPKQGIAVGRFAAALVVPAAAIFPDLLHTIWAPSPKQSALDCGSAKWRCPPRLMQPAVSIKALFGDGNAWLDQAVLAALIEPPASLVSSH